MINEYQPQLHRESPEDEISLHNRLNLITVTVKVRVLLWGLTVPLV